MLLKIFVVGLLCSSFQMGSVFASVDIEVASGLRNQPEDPTFLAFGIISKFAIYSNMEEYTFDAQTFNTFLLTSHWYVESVE